MIVRTTVSSVMCACLLLATTAAAGAQVAIERAGLPFDACTLLGPDPYTDLAGAREELLRLEELHASENAAPRGLRRPSDASGPCGLPSQTDFRIAGVGLTIVPPGAGIVSNSGYPEDRNNGALWAGRGLAAELTGGVRLAARGFSAGVIPTAWFAENREYEFPQPVRPGYSPHANPFYNDIDLPHRFGPDDVVELSLGQSYLRYDNEWFGAGLSLENVWLGPALRNPLLLSNTAAGFPHAFVTTRAIDARIANVHASMLFGTLSESDWFDANSANDDARVSAWSVIAQPRGFEVLELGVARTLRYDPDYGPGGILPALGLGGGDHPGLGMFALSGRLRLPESGAEAWVEWARADGYHSITDDLLTEPEHSQAFVAGFQKVSSTWLPLRLVAEIASLHERQLERVGRTPHIYYTDPAVRQGWTQDGQLLGAGIGPGADAQYLELDWLFETGFAGVFAERVRRNDGSAAAYDLRFDSYLHDTELTGGARSVLVVGAFLLDASASYSHRIQRDFLADDKNVRFTLSVSWWP